MTGFISTNGNYLINASNLSSAGNVIAPYFIGDGSQLTGIATSGNIISSGSSNVKVVSGGGNVAVSVGGVSNVAVFTTLGEKVSGTISSTGDITTAGFFIGDGSQLSNITASGAKIANGSSNVDISTSSGNVTIGVSGVGDVVKVATTGAYVTGIVSASGNVTGNYILGNGSLLTGVITSAAKISNGTSNVDIATASGNVTVGIAGTANVLTINDTRTTLSGSFSATGNVTGNYFIGDGSQLTGISTSGSKISNATSQVNIPVASGNIVASVNNIIIANTTSTGMYVNGVVNASGNVTGGNLISSDNILAAQGYISVANGLISTNVYDGSFVDGIVVDYQEGNGRISVGGADGLNIYNSGVGNVRIASIGIDGAISAAGNVTAAGNISGGYVLGNGYYLSGLSGITYGNANVEAFLPTYTGNLSGGNISITGTSYTDTITAATVANTVSITSKASFAGNANVAGNVNVTGTVNGNLIGTTTGTHNGLVYSIDIRYLSWDFGTITGTYFNPIQYLLAQAGGLDMGTILAPSATSIDIGPITSTP